MVLLSKLYQMFFIILKLNQKVLLTVRESQKTQKTLVSGLPVLRATPARL